MQQWSDSSHQGLMALVLSVGLFLELSGYFGSIYSILNEWHWCINIPRVKDIFLIALGLWQEKLKQFISQVLGELANDSVGRSLPTHTHSPCEKCSLPPSACRFTPRPVEIRINGSAECFIYQARVAPCNVWTLMFNPLCSSLKMPVRLFMGLFVLQLFSPAGSCCDNMLGGCACNVNTPVDGWMTRSQDFD